MLSHGSRVKAALAALEPRQAAIVIAVGMVTVIGAAALVWYFNRQNRKEA